MLTVTKSLLVTTISNYFRSETDNPLHLLYLKMEVKALKCYFLLCPTRIAGVVDVVYVNIVTWYVGCERVGRLVKGGQLLVDQG